MIVNPYAILDALVAVLRLPLGIALATLGIGAWLQTRRAASPQDRAVLENRCYLLVTIAVVVQWLNVLSWPLFYLLLQSYVVEWSGVMCIYGVTQIGVGSVGPSRILPPLLVGLQLFKPALVFASGAWFVLYQLNRQTRSGALLGRVALLLSLVGVLSVVDAAAELTYLIIPKKDVFPWSGCCTEAIAAARRMAGPTPSFGPQDQALLIAAFAAVTAALVLLISWQLLRRGVGRAILLAMTALAACLALPVSHRFLADIVAPRVLHLPNHACAYDLLPISPFAVAAVGLHFLGCFAVGWANLVYWIGNHADAAAGVPGMVRRWLCVALTGYVFSSAAAGLALLLA
jgi:hypothetical protein